MPDIDVRNHYYKVGVAIVPDRRTCADCKTPILCVTALVRSDVDASVGGRT
jgi:hypothetical protein